MRQVADRGLGGELLGLRQDGRRGTALPRIPDEEIDGIIHRDSLVLRGLD